MLNLLPFCQGWPSVHAACPMILGTVAGQRSICEKCCQTNSGEQRAMVEGRRLMAIKEYYHKGHEKRQKDEPKKDDRKNKDQNLRLSPRNSNAVRGNSKDCGGWVGFAGGEGFGFFADHVEHVSDAIEDGL